MVSVDPPVVEESTRCIHALMSYDAVTDISDMPPHKNMHLQNRLY